VNRNADPSVSPEREPDDREAGTPEPVSGEEPLTGDATAAAEVVEAGPLVGAQALAEMRDRWLRAEAETQNVRRRAAREREELRRELEDQWLLELTAVVDDLDRGLDAARTHGAAETWISGFELSGRRLRDLLQRHGVTAVEPIGERFDPRLHEAMLEVEPPPGIAPGHVAQVVTRGWARHGRSLRPAQVAVARGE
jgi:molecular chaperone GrpE